jgi:anti-anti-sigma factor
MSLSVQVDQVGGHPVVVVSGELDQPAVTRLRGVLFETFLAHPVVVVDLTGVSSVGMHGAGAVAMCCYTAGRLERDLRVVPGPALAALAERMGAASVLCRYRNVASALAGAGVLAGAGARGGTRAAWSGLG